MAKRTYEAAVELFAMLCKQYKLNPTADGVIVSHREGHSRGIASNHGEDVYKRQSGSIRTAPEPGQIIRPPRIIAASQAEPWW